ncbi:tetratricopeptide repeat protein [Crocinitomix sp.]|nr:tetratricopeptide repeat protein [Crocinitomix sp.]
MNYLKFLIAFFIVCNLNSGIAQVDKSIQKAIKYSNKADILLNKGKIEKSILLYSKSIELQPKKANHYYKRGIAHQTNKNYQKAFADFDKTVQLDTASKKGYYQRGLAQLKLKNYNAAIADFEIHKGIVGANAEGATRSGRAAMGLNDYESALKYLEEATKIKANDAEVYRLKAEIYMKMEDYAAAEIEIAGVRGLVGGDTKLDLMEARCAIERKNAKRAKTLLNKLLINNPNDASYNLLSKAYSIESNQDSALYCVNKAIELKPTAEYYFNRGTYAALKGDTLDALKDFNTALELDPTYLEAYNHRTYYVWIPQEKYSNAINDMNAFIEANSSNTFAFNNRSYVHFKLGNLDQAFVDACHSLNIKMNNGYVFKNLTLYYYSFGEMEMARKTANFALTNNYMVKKDQEFNAVLDALGISY